MAEEDSEEDFVASESDGTMSASTQDGPAPASRTRRTYHPQNPTQKRTSGYLSNDYRNLLNIDIEALNRLAHGAGLDPSQIGASQWTSREKEAFFHCLSFRGPGDLAALKQAVRTKSEQEVRVYLLLLQDGALAQAAKQRKPRKQSTTMHAEIPAAIEISPECERALDLAADALAIYVEKHTCQQECDKCGDGWLVDEDEAERMDLSYEQGKPLADLTANSSSEADGEALKDTHQIPVLGTGTIPLLRPSSFLQLSRNIFMNNGEDMDLNWHHVDHISADLTEPALFRTALEEFHRTTVSIVRRVVQATIFQATSRLRAEDASRKDWSPLGVIREVDVRTAADLLNLPHDSKMYWATVARRCKVGVYSDSKKFSDGRPSTRTGARLTYDEVESELGFQNAKVSVCQQELDADGIDDDDVDDAMGDSDLFTEDDSDISTATATMDQIVEARTQATRKRKCAPSPSSFHRAEVDHMEALDKAASAGEERRLWDLLRTDPPGDVTMNHPVPVGLLAVNSVAHDTSANWRTHVDYQSDWEQENGIPSPKRFKDLESVGKAAKMKRDVLLNKVRVRLLSDGNRGSNAKIAMDGEGDDTNDEGLEQDVDSPGSFVNSDSEASG